MFNLGLVRLCVVCVLLICGAAGVLVVTVEAAATGACMVCPFCTALKPTLTEEIEATDAVVFAKVLGPGQLTEDGFDRKVRFQVHQILKGMSFVALEDVIETIAPANLEPGQECLVMGVLTDRMMWSTPMKLSDRSREYILAVQTLPLDGPDRIRFFLDYLEDAEDFMAFDAYDEFARTPYDDVKAIKPHMNRDKLVGWVQDPEVSINRKRLYFTLLGVCGSKDELPLLEKMIKSPEKRDRAALDSLLACYLTLAGEEGVSLIEDRFLRDKESDYVDTYAAVAALRFHGTESDVVPVPRIVQAVRLLLDRPEVADLVIADLARWKDWTVTDKLVKMFKDADEKTMWVRVPIVHFLRVNPDPAAKAKIEELRAVDPQSVRRALAFFELEAAMQGNTADAEDDEFERQLKELEREKTEEKKESGGGESGGGENQLSTKPDQALLNGVQHANIGHSVYATGPTDAATRQTVRRPIVEIPSDVNSEIEPIGTNNSQFEATETDNVESAVLLTTSAVGSLNQAEGSQTTVVRANAVRPISEPQMVGEPTRPQMAGITSGSRSERGVADAPAGASLWWIIGLPMAINLGLLVLSWSIINGTFSHLFY